MTRPEVEAWGLVGAGAVIIILLLLEFPGAPAPLVNVTIEGTAGPGPAGNYPIVPPNNPNQPLPAWQLNFPPIPSTVFNLTLTAQPCSCSCSEVQQIQDQNFSGSIDALNQMLKNQTINNAATYFSETPYQNLFATNATGISSLAEAVGLPDPIVTQNVTSPGYTDLGGGGSLSYTFANANPFG